MDEADLIQLVERAAREDQEALALLHRSTLPRVLGLASRICGSRETAEEVACDVYMEVWRRAREYDPGRGSVAGWILTICRSRALDALRRCPSRMVREWSEDAPGEALTDEMEPPDLLAATERDSSVRAALAKLEPEHRELLALAFFRGLSQRDIAAYTGLALGTVKTRLRKAQGLLREEFSR